jgi:AcrR family transcriptional regulator
MTIHSPAVTRIITAAIEHLARRGYDASSLTEIAEAVGIRKASLYSHFASKDALFMAAFTTVLTAEHAAVADSFSNETRDEQAGARYCQDLIARYSTSPELRFFLRTAYIPPASLEAPTAAAHEAYLAQLTASFTDKLVAQHPSGTVLSASTIATFAEVYLGIVDSIQVKLVYTAPAEAATRLTAMQHLFANVLSHSETI